MFFNAILLLSLSPLSLPSPKKCPPPMTVTRVFHSITDVPPFIVDATTVFTFTPSPSTQIAFPTGTGI
ncbi:hypothetical protein B0H17DRAFT_1211996 [Mycena rosella]|uniref:Secreted protein n=1 Tax=Mycena rosella TaxID=1033263 RepID=A0AAD7CT95_MYCRO|nr:hypothetical protein B0H17DRAFT_1211996 [Mycena rosella]